MTARSSRRSASRVRPTVLMLLIGCQPCSNWLLPATPMQCKVDDVCYHMVPGVITACFVYQRLVLAQTWGLLVVLM